MSQLALDYDDRMSGNHRRSDPVSSVAAARTVNAEHQRGKILAALNAAGRPLWGSKIAAVTGIPTGEVLSRLAAMARRQMVERLEEMGENDRGQPVLLWQVPRRPLGSRIV